MKLCPVCQNTYPDDYRTCPRDQVVLVDPHGEIVAGTVLRGKYEVLGELGAGGMATVYKVRHKAFHELAAVKVVHPQFMHDPDFVKRFRNEAVVARQLKHPNAVRIDDFDYTDDGRPFIVMEYVEGKSLYETRKWDYDPWPAERCLNIVRQAASALAAAHKLGIVHRDIKPANILILDGSGTEGKAARVKILDFGIAKVGDKSFAGMTSVMTQQDMVIGTPEYMSPEQAGGRTETPIDGRSDVYSLGLVFYEMLTGAHPFHADTPMAMLIHQVHTPPPPPDSMGVEVSPALSALLLKCLRKDPNERFQSADDLLMAMEDPDAWYSDRVKGKRIAAERVGAPGALRDPSETAPAVRIPKAPTVLAGAPPRAAVQAPPNPAPAPADETRTDEELAPAERRSRWPLMVVGVVAAAVLLVCVAILIMRRQAPAPVLPQPAPAVSPVLATPPPAPPPAVSAVDQAKVAKLIASGNRSLASGDLDIAAQFFDQALSLDPSNAEARAGLQNAQAGQGAKAPVR